MEIAVISAAIAAFLGALFAFGVSQLNEHFKKNRERWFKHRNALVNLEYKLNSILGIISDNKHTFSISIKSYSNSKTHKIIIWAVPHTIPFDSSILNSFLDIEMINEIFSYNENIRKSNHDVNALWRAYSEMRNSFLKNEITEVQYMVSLKEFCEGIKLLNQAYDLIDNRTIKLLAGVRLSLRKDKQNDQRWAFFMTPKLRPLDDEEVESEIELLRKELKDTQKRSRDELDIYFTEPS